MSRTPMMDGAERPLPGNDLLGRTIEYLTVLEVIPPQRTGDRWLARCRCVCGTERLARLDHLRSHRAKSCGCKTGHDLRGHLIGQFKVIERADPVLQGGRWLTAWRVACLPCGREIVVGTHRLLHPISPVRHCGCQWLLPSAPPTMASASAPAPDPAATSTPAATVSAPRPRTALFEREQRTTSAGEALRRFHDTHSPLGATRVVCRPVTEDDDVEQAATDLDPFT